MFLKLHKMLIFVNFCKTKVQPKSTRTDLWSILEKDRNMPAKELSAKNKRKETTIVGGKIIDALA